MESWSINDPFDHMNIDLMGKQAKSILLSSTTPLHKNYLFVFMLVGIITLIPLVAITIAVLLKSGMSKTCRLLLICTCIALGSIVAALIFVHYALGSQDLILARGDQILIGEQSNNGLTIDLNELRSIACNRLEIHSNKLRIRVWASPISPHYGPQQNYSLFLRNWTLPNIARLRLNTGDQISWHNFTIPARTSILKGNEAWNKWSQTGSYQMGYEKCCAWKILETNYDIRNDNLSYVSNLQIDESEIYTFIFRPLSIVNIKLNEHPEMNNHHANGLIDLSRIRWAPNLCDPIICEGYNTLICSINSVPKSFIIDYSIEQQTAPNHDYAQVKIICYPRHWALGLIFSTPTLMVLIFISTIWLCLKKRKRTHVKFTGTELKPSYFHQSTRGKFTNTTENGNPNPSFEFDLV